MWIARLLLAACLALLASSVGAEPSDRQLTWARYAELRELVLPRPDEEPWSTVAWRSSLWDARREAARDGRPILLWQMSGNPLGCT